MNKVISIILVLVMSFSLAACQNKEEVMKNIEPDAAQMKSICELATMKCYYHNVAKYNEEDASGFWLWKKARKFWVEYSGIVTIGIDTSSVDIDVNAEKVTITLPPAKVLDCKVDEDTLDADSFVVANDSAKVEAEHQTKAFKEAQDKMQKQASNDTVLLANAQQRTQQLLEDYVNNIGASVGKNYDIEWKYLEDAEELNQVDTEVASTENGEESSETSTDAAE